MSRKSLESLGQLQRMVIEVVWELSEATVHQVRDRLSRRKKPAYTTVLTAMQKLERAGWLRHRSQGKSYIYIPTRTRQEADASSLKRFVKKAFDGDAMLIFQHLIRQSNLTDEELRQLRKMIDQARKDSQE